jgi:hypothetical protein
MARDKPRRSSLDAPPLRNRFPIYPEAVMNPTSPAPNSFNPLDRPDAPMTNGANGASASMPNDGNGKPAPSANASNGAGRDNRGRFAAGNAGGPGNPFARRMAAFRKALCAAVSEQDIRDVAARLLQAAKGGDVAAAKVLLAYTVGRPPDAVNPDTLDLEEWRLFRQTPVQPDDLACVLNNIGPATACTILRPALPLMADRRERELAERLRATDPRQTRHRRRRGRKPSRGEAQSVPGSPKGVAPSVSDLAILPS